MSPVMLYLPPVPSAVAEESETPSSSHRKEVAGDLVQRRRRHATRGLVLVVNGVNGQPAPEVLVVGVLVGRQETQFLEEKNVPENGKRHANLLPVPLTASKSGLTGPGVTATMSRRRVKK